MAVSNLVTIILVAFKFVKIIATVMLVYLLSKKIPICKIYYSIWMIKPSEQIVGLLTCNDL